MNRAFGRHTTGHVAAIDEDDDRRALVRAIAASPVHMQWLRDHAATVLDREARVLEGLGDTEAADHLRSRAQAHRAGETPLW